MDTNSVKVPINEGMSKDNEDSQYSVVYHSGKTAKSFICRNTCGTGGGIISRLKRQYHMPLPICRNGNVDLAEERVDQ